MRRGGDGIWSGGGGRLAGHARQCKPDIVCPLEGYTYLWLPVYPWLSLG